MKKTSKYFLIFIIAVIIFVYIVLCVLTAPGCTENGYSFYRREALFHEFEQWIDVYPTSFWDWLPHSLDKEKRVDTVDLYEYGTTAVFIEKCKFDGKHVEIKLSNGHRKYY